MKERKVHFVVDVRRTIPKYFMATATYVLCHMHNAERVTRDRSLVTCGICNHFIKEYGDKHVIERGNLPASVLSSTERFAKFRAEIIPLGFPGRDAEWVRYPPTRGHWSSGRYRK